MSGLAELLAAGGHRVSGSDEVDSPVLDQLRDRGVDVWVGHRPGGVGEVDALAASTAVPPDDPEVLAARAAGVPVLTRAQLLRSLAALRRVAAISGTHGKTTTTAMVSRILEAAGSRPSYLVGGQLPGQGVGARWDDGEWFVVEADESDGTFLELGAESVLVTNVEPDHLDHWGTEAALRHAFERFVAGAGGRRLVCADDPGASALAALPGVTTYGESGGATFRVVGLEPVPGGSRFEVWREAELLADVRLAIPGRHLALNAAGALALTVLLGSPPEAARRALAVFAGVGRRFERRGEAGGITFVDDYAHLPTEVAANVRAAREGGWRRVVCVFQPHRYSRTEALAEAFGPSFEGADLVVVTDVYGAGEAPQPGVTGRLVAEAVGASLPAVPVRYAPGRDELVAVLLDELREGDVCLTLGAGDLTTLPDELLGRLRGEA
ncbi:MAG: UDP-N-acetylmuramate--L-alanine ligase [Acidimicrobiales bacterium]|nr:UDP-N-acetylmuramate--L-alanine ligase [Acidimicrobiales bacterium]